MVCLYLRSCYVCFGKWLVFYFCKLRKHLWFCSDKDWYLGVVGAAVSQTWISYLLLSSLKNLPSSLDGLAAQAASNMVFQRSKILLQRCLGYFAPIAVSAMGTRSAVLIHIFWMQMSDLSTVVWCFLNRIETETKNVDMILCLRLSFWESTATKLL